MLTKYIKAALHQAKYKILSDDGTFYGEIPGLQGVWANTDTLSQTGKRSLPTVKHSYTKSKNTSVAPDNFLELLCTQ